MKSKTHRRRDQEAISEHTLHLLKDALSVLYVARSEASGATIGIHQD